MLLTDEIANVGETDPDRIAADTLAYNQQSGINVSTIGLGLDMNDALLSTLARQGHGAYHFVNSAQEMDKVFQQEVEGLLQKVASDVRVSIEVYPGASLTMITGLDGVRRHAGPKSCCKTSVPATARSLGPGAGPRLPAGRADPHHVTLHYLDVFAQSPREAVFEVRAQFGGGLERQSVDGYRSPTERNHCASAQALRTIDGMCQQGLYEQAWQVAANMERD